MDDEGKELRGVELLFDCDAGASEGPDEDEVGAAVPRSESALGGIAFPVSLVTASEGRANFELEVASRPSAAAAAACLGGRGSARASSRCSDSEEAGVEVTVGVIVPFDDPLGDATPSGMALVLVLLLE